MPNLKLTIEYEGTAYHGWQAQPDCPTVQAAVQEGLALVLRAPVIVRGAARTDSGVHAHGQVASLQTPGPVDPDGLRRKLNRVLPADIRIREAAVVADDFHARHSARGRIYTYRIVDSEHISPFLRAFALHSRHRLDTDRMSVAAAQLIGKRDFSSFRAAGDMSESPVKEICRSEISVEGGEQRVIVYTVEANSFLQYMVRNIAGTLIEVGRGRIDPQEIQRILEGRDRRLAGPTAPAIGLHLERVLYDDLARCESG